jgi:hypothetical protein
MESDDTEVSCFQSGAEDKPPFSLEVRQFYCGDHFEIQLATIGGAQLVSPTQKVPTERKATIPVCSIKNETAAYKSFHRRPSQDSALLLD